MTVIDCATGEARDHTPEELEAIEAARLANPVRRLIPKSTVTARLIGLGKAGDVKALFDANPEMHFKWFAPDWPNVYADDEGLLQALDAIGCTEAEIAAVTAEA